MPNSATLTLDEQSVDEIIRQSLMNGMITDAKFNVSKALRTDPRSATYTALKEVTDLFHSLVNGNCDYLAFASVARRCVELKEYELAALCASKAEKRNPSWAPLMLF